MSRVPKGTPTDINLSVLARYFRTGDRIRNQIEQVSAPHMRRCMKAGLLAIDPADKGYLVLTAAGAEIVHTMLVKMDSDNEQRVRQY